MDSKTKHSLDRECQVRKLEKMTEEKLKSKEKDSKKATQKVAGAFRKKTLNRKLESSIYETELQSENDTKFSFINDEKIGGISQAHNEVNEELRKLGLVGNNSKQKSKRNDHYRVEPNKDILHQKLEIVAREKEKMEELFQIQEDEEIKGYKSNINLNPTGNVIKPSDMEFCLKHTNFTSEQINNWFKGFRVECPNGRLTKNHLHSLFCKILPGEDSEAFCCHIFRIFDSDGNNFLDFKEFLMALDVSSLRSESEKLEWAFRLYDSDYSGSISLKEIQAVMETFSVLEGMDTSESEMSDEFKALQKMNSQERAEYIFHILDVDNDGEVSLEEFVEGYMKLKQGIIEEKND